MYGIDFTDTHAPTMVIEGYKMNEAELLNFNAASYREEQSEVLNADYIEKLEQLEAWIRECWDLKGAFYQSIPDPNMPQFMEQPPGFGETPASYAAIDLKSDSTPAYHPIAGAHSKYVWKLLRCMPGTKNAGHLFNKQLTEFMTSVLGLGVNPADGASFYGKFGKEWIRFNTHVDDMAVFSNSRALVDRCYKRLNTRFPCKRRSDINLLLGISIVSKPGSIEFNQTRLIDDLVQYTGQEQGRHEHCPFPSSWGGFTKEDRITDPEARITLDKWPYPNALGKAAYIARCTRYDILWVVAVLQRHMKDYGPAMIKILLQLVRFLRVTRTKPLIFLAGYPRDLAPLVIMVDATYASSKICL